jgi:Photosynthetic reaction centre cytochrome C subunit
MAARRAIVLIGTMVAIYACTKTPASSSPTPAALNANQEPAVVPPRRLPISRDSTAKLRATYVAQVLQSIAGRENEPAEQVFKNIQVLKGMRAVDLVHMMDTVYGRQLGWNCVNCHRLAPQGNFASDTSANKVRARFMQQMTNDINEAQLPKLYPRDTPKITCGTCHRGYNEPPPAQYMIPERGQPGGPPLPTPRGGTPPARPPAN